MPLNATSFLMLIVFLGGLPPNVFHTACVPHRTRTELHFHFHMPALTFLWAWKLMPQYSLDIKHSIHLFSGFFCPAAESEPQHITMYWTSCTIIHWQVLKYIINYHKLRHQCPAVCNTYLSLLWHCIPGLKRIGRLLLFYFLLSVKTQGVKCFWSIV